jgi:hypothetical protein
LGALVSTPVRLRGYVEHFQDVTDRCSSHSTTTSSSASAGTAIYFVENRADALMSVSHVRYQSILSPFQEGYAVQSHSYKSRHSLLPGTLAASGLQVPHCGMTPRLSVQGNTHSLARNSRTIPRYARPLCQPSDLSGRQRSALPSLSKFCAYQAWQHDNCPCNNNIAMTDTHGIEPKEEKYWAFAVKP